MAKCIPHKKSSCLIREETRDARLDYANYCVAGLMSRCAAGTVWHEQKICKYAEKSTVSNRCMHFIEAIGGHCDCAEAQRELRKALKVEADKA
jgi:hypothetical protein